MVLFSAKKVFKTSQQIKDALFQIKDLDYRKRPNVYEALVKELDDTGVSQEEIKRVVWELKKKGEISEIDERNLLQLLK